MPLNFAHLDAADSLFALDGMKSIFPELVDAVDFAIKPLQRHCAPRHQQSGNGKEQDTLPGRKQVKYGIRIPAYCQRGL